MKLKIYTVDGLKYCPKNECNNMMIKPRQLIHPSSSANWPPDVAVTVNINAEWNLSLIWWQLAPWLNAVQGFSSPDIVTGDYDLESSVVYTVPPIFLESLRGRSNRSLSHLPLHMQSEGNLPTFSKSNFYIGLCLLKAATLTRLRSYELS